MENNFKNIITGNVREESQLGLAISRFKRNKLAVAGLIMSSFYLLIAILGPWIAPHDPTAINAQGTFASPSLEHPLGTDNYGRDVFSRILVGARASLLVAVIVTGFSTVFGVILALLAGFYGGWTSGIIMRGVDILMAFPAILMALVVIAIFGPGLYPAIFALAIAYTPIMIRVARGSVLTEREEEYVLAAKSYGESSWRIMSREILPNLISVVLVQASITFAFAILSEAGLSYLGLSAQPPTVTWGLLISEGQNYVLRGPWLTLFPGLAIMFTVLGLSFLGIGLRDALDPKSDTEQNMGGI